MTRNQWIAQTLFAAGMIALGILAFVYGDFALVWQPVPASVPGRTALAYLSGVIMVAGGIGLLFPRTATLAIRVLFPYLIIWTLLRVPSIVASPGTEEVWLGTGELIILLSGGWALFARLAALPPGSKLAFATGDSGRRIARYLFAIALVPVGLSHFVYAKATADMVPAWLPGHTGWAYLTGAGHIAAGLGVLFSVLPRLAAIAEAAMLSVFTLVVWIPAIAAAPTTRLPWTAFWISWIFTAAAWLVAESIAPVPATARSTGSFTTVRVRRAPVRP
jgi:uncharacterized membrane protein